MFGIEKMSVWKRRLLLNVILLAYFAFDLRRSHSADAIVGALVVLLLTNVIPFQTEKKQSKNSN
jgi:hypothetical protein